MDAEIKLTVENAEDKTIVVTNTALKFLEKYGFEVIVLNDDTIDKTFSDVRKLVRDGDVKYLYVFKEDAMPDKVKKFMEEVDIERTVLYRLDSITDEQRNNDKDYVSIMRENLDLIKLEIYDEE